MTSIGQRAKEPPGPRAERSAANDRGALQAGPGWPPSVYACGDEAWHEYLHDLYYLGGLLYVAGKGEAVLRALVGVVEDQAVDRQSTHVAKRRLGARHGALGGAAHQRMQQAGEHQVGNHQHSDSGPPGEGTP